MALSNTDVGLFLSMAYLGSLYIFPLCTNMLQQYFYCRWCLSWKISQQYLLIAACNVHWAMFYFPDKFFPLWYSFPTRSLLLCWSKFYSTIKNLFCPFISQSLVFFVCIVRNITHYATYGMQIRKRYYFDIFKTNRQGKQSITTLLYVNLLNWKIDFSKTT